MANQENSANKREDFKKYLSDLGVIDALTNVLANLYQLETRPTDPLDYIRTHMTEIVQEREELKMLKANYNSMISQIQEMEEQNMELAKSIKELENYGNELSKSKLEEVDENNVETE
ncbi:PREDICTED: C-Myc-binding protein homolog [Diuraphis noxia]|uniref:C-Myc-binding protein homolog n=1 Tax=Diuraphis noxia TaxID=143948 RepID=UPI0007638033|nr:PREDICTED: C-Myc-binding protein homolog [Diuraphis noxia]